MGNGLLGMAIVLRSAEKPKGQMANIYTVETALVVCEFDPKKHASAATDDRSAVRQRHRPAHGAGAGGKGDQHRRRSSFLPSLPLRRPAESADDRRVARRRDGDR